MSKKQLTKGVSYKEMKAAANGSMAQKKGKGEEGLDVEDHLAPLLEGRRSRGVMLHLTT